MKRALRLILVCLSIGVVINIAVAWACGMWSEYDIDTLRHGSWSQSRLPNAERTPISAWTVHGFGVRNMHILQLALYESPELEPIEDVLEDWELFTDLDALASDRNLDFFMQGWPMHALWCEYVANERQTHGGVWIHGEHIPGTFYTAEHFIAFRPIWKGFVFNSLFYAAAVLVPFVIVTQARRWRRRRRGLCERCAYPVGTSCVCSECGAPVHARQPKPSASH